MVLIYSTTQQCIQHREQRIVPHRGIIIYTVNIKDAVCKADVASLGLEAALMARAGMLCI